MPKIKITASDIFKYNENKRHKKMLERIEKENADEQEKERQAENARDIIYKENWKGVNN